MSLINCPECNKEISNIAKSCPYCGFPVSEISNNNNYTIININRYGNPALPLIKIICNMFNITISDAAKIIDTPNSKIISGLSLENAKYIESVFSPYCKTEITHSETEEDNNDIINAYRAKVESPVCCPRCHSQSITTGQRGYSLLTGFLGSNKTTNRCAKCGYSWQP